MRNSRLKVEDFFSQAVIPIVVMSRWPGFIGCHSTVFKAFRSIQRMFSVLFYAGTYENK